MSASIVYCWVFAHLARSEGSGEQRDPPRGETANDTYVAAVQADGQTGSGGRFLGHIEVVAVGVCRQRALGDVEGEEEK